MCPPNDQFHGCELRFIDTVFFDSKQGRASELIFTSKDGFVSSIKSEKRLKFLAIQTHFSEVVRERRRAFPPAAKELYEDQYFERSASNMRTTMGSDLMYSDRLQH